MDRINSNRRNETRAVDFGVGFNPANPVQELRLDLTDSVRKDALSNASQRLKTAEPGIQAQSLPNRLVAFEYMQPAHAVEQIYQATVIDGHVVA